MSIERITKNANLVEKGVRQMYMAMEGAGRGSGQNNSRK